MSAQQELRWLDYRRDGNVAVFETENWERLFEEEIEAGEKAYAELAGDPAVTATVVVFNSVAGLDGEMQDHITEVWSQLAQAVDIEKAGYVADGITAMAVTSNVTAPGVEVDSFTTLDDALEWASA